MVAVALASCRTVKTYYQLLEDMFLGFRVPAFSGSPRKSLLSTERFFFFDLGVRNAAAEMPMETAAVRANPRPLFEQWVGIELLSCGSVCNTSAAADCTISVARPGQKWIS